MGRQVVILAILNIAVGHEHERWNLGTVVNMESEQEMHVTLVTFDNAKGTTYNWRAMNDPVMGGKSHSTFGVDGSEGHFKGTCAIVPFLKAPGFCKAGTQRSLVTS